MTRVALVLVLIALIVEVAALVSCALTPQSQVRGIPKPLWLVAILVFPGVGAVLWFVFGRERGARSMRSAGPDDDPDFLRSLGGPRRSAPPAAKNDDDDVIRSLEDALRDPDPDPDDGEPGRRRG
jgi:hypothetical protein